MSDPTNASQDTISVKRIVSGALAGGIASWCLTQESLHGIDFKVLGLDSELVKGAITSTATGFIMAPDKLAYAIRDFFLGFVRFFNIIRKGSPQE